VSLTGLPTHEPDDIQLRLRWLGFSREGAATLFNNDRPRRSAQPFTALYSSWRRVALIDVILRTFESCVRRSEPASIDRCCGNRILKRI
jgi:hypothetical protein